MRPGADDGEHLRHEGARVPVILLLLASCGNPPPQVSPPPGPLPVDPVIYFSGDWLEIADQDGNAVIFREVERASDVRVIRVYAAPGTVFTVATQGRDHYRLPKLFGPYRVAAQAAQVPKAAHIERVRRIAGAAVLWFDPPDAPAYRVAVDGHPVLLLPQQNFLGWFDCGPDTWKWKTESAVLHVAALNASGQQGPWGPR